MPEIPVKIPVAEISQSEVLISPVSPLSPKMKRPAVWKLAAMEPAPSKKAALSTSNPPTIKRSLMVSMVLEVAVATPKREYAAEAKPPTCKVLPVRRYEAEAVPWTSKVVEGAWPMPIKKPARLMVRLASNVMELTNSSKSKELDDTPPPAVAQVKVPDPFVVNL